METVPISKFKAECPELLARVQRTGQPILVTKRGKPLAQVVPAPTSQRPRLLGCMEGTGRILGDIVNPDAEYEKLWTYDEENILK